MPPFHANFKPHVQWFKIATPKSIQGISITYITCDRFYTLRLCSSNSLGSKPKTMAYVVCHGMLLSINPSFVFNKRFMNLEQHKMKAYVIDFQKLNICYKNARVLTVESNYTMNNKCH